MCNPDELNALIRECQGKLLRYAEHFLKSADAAQDAVQDAYVRYIRHIRNADPARRKIDNLSAWLFRTTRNICLDLLRSARVRLEVSASPGPEDEDRAPDEHPAFTAFDTPETALRENDDRAFVRSLIESELTPREKEALILKFEEDKSYREIAEIMGVSIGHTGSLIHHAVKKLRSATARSQK